MNNDLTRKEIKESQLKLKEKWIEKNKEALQEYNNWIEKNGIFTDKSRKF